MSLALNIRRLRGERGWSRETLARKADVSASTIYRTERGETVPRFSALAAIAKALEASLDELTEEQAA